VRLQDWTPPEADTRVQIKDEVVLAPEAAQFAAARYQVGVGKRRLGVRPNALFGPNEEGLMPVEVFDRKAWTSVICKSIDFGFLQIDPRSRVLLFEGDKNRWHLPASSLTRCRIEEAHVGSEGNAQAEKRYYVALSVDCDGEEWEVGLIPTRSQFGHDGKDARYARARALFEQLEEVVARRPASAHTA
jgi:hypothetical protein